MRRVTVRIVLPSVVALAVGVAVAACGDARATESSHREEIARDLELASAVTMALAGGGIDSANFGSLENMPAAAPEGARAAPRESVSRVRRSGPSVAADPAADAGEGAAVDALANGALPDISEPVATLPLPAPVPAATPAGDYGTGTGALGDAGGGRIGGGTGVVIRGGGVYGDNCELHRRRPRGPTTRGPVYVPAQPTSRPATASGPSRGGVSIGSRNPGTVSRRPEKGSSAAPDAPAAPRERPGRADPRTSRRGI